jgi:hypothetical protein
LFIGCAFEQILLQTQHVFTFTSQEAGTKSNTQFENFRHLTPLTNPINYFAFSVYYDAWNQMNFSLEKSF